MKTSRTLLLDFTPETDRLAGNKRLSDGLSAVVQAGDTLWVAHDESISLERLSLTRAPDSGLRAGSHSRFDLSDFLSLPAGTSDKIEEADVEGLAVDDGYLWLVGSHSLKRKNPRKKDDADEVRRRLARHEGDGNRYLLARIPLVDKGHSLTRTHGQRSAAQLHGDRRGNDLTAALRRDEHLGPFLPTPPGLWSRQWQGIPGKDNGFDIEGLAAADGRLFLGLRGPVLRGWAVILELAPETDGKDPARLRLKAIGPGGRPYRKHLLQLGGNGIRDLCVAGDDLLILAGPTMDLDGPAQVYRWPNGTRPKGEAVARREDLEKLPLTLPYGPGTDRAEGLSLFDPPAGTAGLLVVYDAASPNRQPGPGLLAADVFPLPGA